MTDALPPIGAHLETSAERPDPTAARGVSPRPAAWVGPLLVLGLTFAWGANWPAMKRVLTEVDPWTFRAWCLLLSGCLLLAVARLTGQVVMPARGDWLRLLAAGAPSVTGWQILSAYGLTVTEAGRAAIMAYTMPVWAAVLAIVFLGERLTLLRIAALLLGLGGIAFLEGRSLLAFLTSGVPGAALGAIFMTGAALSWAIGTIVLKRFRPTIGGLASAGWLLLIGGIPVVVVAASSPDRLLPDLSQGAWLSFAYVVMIGIGIGHWLWVRIVAHYPAQVAAIATLGVPVVGLVSSAILLGEPIGVQESVALVLIVGGVAAVVLVPEGAVEGAPASPARSRR